MHSLRSRAAIGLAAGLVAGLLLFTLRRPGARPSDGPTASSPSPFRFTDVTKEAGITFVHDNGRAGRYLYPENMGAGVALFDYDGDGDLDIFFVNGNRLEGAADPKIHSVLYRNDGDGRFTDVSEAAGLAAVGFGQGACVGDVDGDGHLDLYVTFIGPNRFFHNRGDGTFTETTKEVGLEDDGWGQSCSFLDFDNDGDLDLFSLNYLTYAPTMPQEVLVVRGGRRVKDYIGPWAFEGQASRLCQNRGDGTFDDVTQKAGVYRPDGKGMGVATVDFDGDGRTDMFQSNDGVANFYFHNLGGGRFEEIGLMAGVAVGRDGNAKASMGVDVGDVDNDGDTDIVFPVVRQEVYSLYRNEGTVFTDASFEAGLAETTGHLTGFSPNLADFDNDGALDLFFVNGEVNSHDTVGADADYVERYGTRDTVLAGDGGGRFRDVSAGSGPHFARALVGRGSATGDIDNDGDVDVVILNTSSPAVVLRNDSKGGHWLGLELRQAGKNWQAIGAKVWVRAGGLRQYREVHGGGPYLSANDRRLHFGLGSASQAETVEIRWPDGARETRGALPADRFVRIERSAPRP